MNEKHFINLIKGFLCSTLDSDARPKPAINATDYQPISYILFYKQCNCLWSVRLI